jgi:translation initiation factor IF-2
MRARGAHITDIVVLVVAADEGIMPQTQEAIDHARAAGVPIVVALNKMDRSTADPDRVKKQLSEKGLSAEDWGGDTIVVPVSATTGSGIDSLLEMILLQAEMLELKANKDKHSSGIIVEANLSRGRGAVTTLIVQSGTLHLNDFIVVGTHYGKVKAMFDDCGRHLEEAGPSTPVEMLGLDGVPEAGAKFYVVDDERIAREITEKRRLEVKDHRFSMAKRITLEDLYSQIQDGVVKELNVILKADVQGSLEALRDSLAKIPSEEVKVKFIHMGVGDVNASDVILAVASNAIIIAFHVGIGPRAAQELEHQPVDIRQYRIIYDAVDDVKKSLSGLLAPKIKRTFLARVEVRQVFKLSKSGAVAGCMVLKGKVKRKDKVEVFRNGEIIYKGQVASLKRFKDDVREVAEGYECGLTLDHFDELQEGDVVEVYHEEAISRTI